MTESLEHALKFFLREYLEKELFKCKSTLMDYEPRRKKKRPPDGLVVVERRMYAIQAILREMDEEI